MSTGSIGKGGWRGSDVRIITGVMGVHAGHRPVCVEVSNESGQPNSEAQRMEENGIHDLKIFASRSSRVLADRVCARLGMKLGNAHTNVFPDGELLVKLDEDVRGRDCFVIVSTCEPVNDNLMELLVFLG